MKPSRSHFDSVDDSPLKGHVGSSRAMGNVYQLTRIAAQSDASVLLLGETGTGKSLVASALHELSGRASSPFIHIHCSTFNDQQLDVELFGASDPSSLDPDSDRAGQLEEAQGGVLFLDEINATSPTIQSKLLRVLQERRFERTGTRRLIEVDVRIVAACSLDLNQEVTEGNFREDLFWRLGVIPIAIPPLRRREGDVELLVRHFLDHYSHVLEKPIQKINADAMKALIDYQWPGNVWELQNYVERAVVLTQSGQIETSLFPTAVMGDAQAAQVAVFRPTDDQSLIREFVYSRLSKSETDAKDIFKRIVGPVEKELLEQVMALCSQTQVTAARKLGMNRNTLYKKLVEYGLAKPKSSDSVEGPSGAKKKNVGS